MNLQKLTYEEVKKTFEDAGCILLESEYKNARTKMKYQCNCGRESHIVLCSFKNGNRCKECGKKKAANFFFLGQEHAQKKFNDLGMTLLSEYAGASKKCIYKCYCGYVSEGIPNNIWRRRRCGMCGTKARSGSGHYMWIKDREEMNERYCFKQRCYKLVKMVLNVTGRVKNYKTEKLLGYDYKMLQEHITNHPNWIIVKDNAWHVDHIFPIKAFMDYGIKDLKLINALDNIQPLAANDNLCKNAKYEKEEFERYLKKKGIDYESPNYGI